MVKHPSAKSNFVPVDISPSYHSSKECLKADNEAILPELFSALSAKDPSAEQPETAAATNTA